MVMPEIDGLLQADDENVPKIRQLLSELSPRLPALMDQAAVLYKTANVVFGRSFPDHFQEVADAVGALGVSSIRDLEGALSIPAPSGREAFFAQSTDALNRFYARQNRAILLGRIGILYAVAVTDLLRIRVTAALGCVRVQCESVALMKIMYNRPEVGRQWSEVMTEAEGKRFYRKHQGEVRDTVRSFGLEAAYDSASSSALHSRFSGISLGLEVGTTAVDGVLVETLRIKAQELDPNDPDLFFLFVLHVLRVQERILSHLKDANPELVDRTFLDGQVPNFTKSVDALYGSFGRRRPDLVARAAMEAAD